MRRTVSSTVEATIIIAVIAYFLVEGFTGNAALIMFVGMLFEGRKQRQ